MALAKHEKKNVDHLFVMFRAQDYSKLEWHEMARLAGHSTFLVGLASPVSSSQDFGWPEEKQKRFFTSFIQLIYIIIIICYI